MSFGVSAILYPNWWTILILFAAHKWVDNHLIFPCLFIYSWISLPLFRICLRHLGIFCIFYVSLSETSIGFLSLKGILYLLWLIALLRIDFGNPWCPFFWVKHFKAALNFIKWEALSWIKLLKLRFRGYFYIKVIIIKILCG